MLFSTYMQTWLYGKEGYYTKQRDIGKKGDFYTAVSTSIFFGGSIAKRLIHTIESGFLSPSSYVVEIGAHKGFLLADMIQFIYTLKPSLLETLTFVIVEPFIANQQMQKAYFKEAFDDKITLKHVNDLKQLHTKEAFVVANEIFDAFACEVINQDRCLWIENHHAFFKPMDSFMLEAIKPLGICKGEVCFGYLPFAQDLARSFERYEFVTFDYGDKEAREDFSLRIYAQHQTYPFFTLTDLVDASLRAPYSLEELFQKADMTYDVNFTQLINAFVQTGAREELYMTQMRALISFGLIELLEILQHNSSLEVYTQEMRKIKILLDPAFMGERFKMLCLRFG